MRQNGDNGNHLRNGAGERPPVWRSAKSAAESAGLKYDTLLKRIKRHPERYNGAVRQVTCPGGFQYLVNVAELAPELLDHRADAAIRGNDAADLALLSEGDRQKATQRRDVLEAFERFRRDHCRGSGSRVRDFQRFAGLYRTKYSAMPRQYRRLRAWERAYGKSRMVGLVDHRGRTANDSHPSIVDLFLCEYLQESRPTVKHCRRTVDAFARGEGLNNPSVRWWQLKVNDADFLPRPTRVYWREGPKAYDAKCAAYLELDWTRYAAGEFYISDHHICDFFVTDGRGKVRRPWITAISDGRTRLVVGLHIGLETNSETILLALHHAFGNYGPCDILKIDNGADYASRRLHGLTKQQQRARRALERRHPDLVKVSCQDQRFALLPAVGVKVSYSLPFHPQSKPIERLFLTFEEQFGKQQPFYCGHSPDTRPESLRDRFKAGQRPPTLAEVRPLMDKWFFGEYATREHSALGGLSPLDAWTKFAAQPRRMLDPKTLALLCAIDPLPRTIRKNGVEVGGIRYGQFDGRLRALMGTEVLVARNPRRIEQVHILSMDRRYLCTVDANERFDPGATSEQNREALRRVNAIKRLDRDWRQHRHKRLRTVAQETIRLQREEAAAEAGRLRKAAGAEGQTTFVLTGLEQAASDVATAEHREQLRAVTGGADTAPPKRSFAEAELIDPAEVARQARLPDLIDQGSEPEWDDEDDSAWKRLRSDA